MLSCWNRALVLSGDATRTWASAAGTWTDFDAAAWAAWADSLAWLSVAAEDALSHVSMTTCTVVPRLAWRSIVGLGQVFDVDCGSGRHPGSFPGGCTTLFRRRDGWLNTTAASTAAAAHTLLGLRRQVEPDLHTHY